MVISGLRDFAPSFPDYGSGGSRKVAVLVQGKGYAQADPPVTFTYTIAISSVTPNSGSLAGGTLLRITGSNFGESKEGVSVILKAAGSKKRRSVSNNECDVVSVNMSQITCRTPADQAGGVDVEVVIEGSSSTSSSAFTYDSSLTPTVSDIRPRQGAVGGGGVLTITGSGFGTDQDAQVFIGDAECEIQSVTDGEVRCDIPSQGAGQPSIRVYIPDKGYAEIPPSLVSFAYELHVSSICPLVGSVAGGTTLTVSGQGFKDGDTKVRIGDRECAVTQVTSSEVLCESASIFKTVQVDNSGNHPGKSLLHAP